MKHHIAFISGLSGTGKSALVQYFRKHPPTGWIVYDFDENGRPVPEHREEHHRWRIERSEEWLRQGMQNAEKGMHTAVFGLSLYPSAMKKLPAANAVERDHIHFALLHAQHEVRRERIMRRENSSAWQGIQPWYDEFYREMKECGAPIFDTTTAPLEETAGRVQEWLSSITKD